MIKSTLERFRPGRTRKIYSCRHWTHRSSNYLPNIYSIFLF